MSDGYCPRCRAKECDLDCHAQCDAEVERLAAEVDRLTDGIRKLAVTIEAFGVERTEWMSVSLGSVVDGQAPGFAVPDDCDAANVVIDSDVYEAALDLVALLDVAGDDREDGR